MTKTIKGWVTLLISLPLILLPVTGHPCSAFFGEGTTDNYMAKSYDWNFSHGFLMVNKRGVEKTSFQFIPQDRSITWVSEHGSVSFNQYGHEFPLGGLNEAGLAIEVLWLNESEYPRGGSLPVLNELQWIQYHLDMADNIEEMIENSRRVRIKPVTAKVHYLACDASGACAVFEYLDGKLEIHSTTDLAGEMPVPSITNNSYAASMRYARDYQTFGGSKEIPEGYGSLARFVRASYMAKTFSGNKSFDNYFFDILDSVAGGSYSKWNIVYSLGQKRISFLARYNQEAGKVNVDLGDFNFDCNEPVMARKLDSHDGWRGESRFSRMSKSKNALMVRKALSGDLPDIALNMVINYPNSTKCVR